MNALSWVFVAVLVAFVGIMIYKQKKRGTGSKGQGVGNEPRQEPKDNREGDLVN